MNKEKVLTELDALHELVSTQERIPCTAAGVLRAMEVIEQIPDDNPWIPTKERLPKDSEYARVYMTIKPYANPGTIKGNIDNGKFYYANGKPVQCPVLAWKYLRYPEPYKEES